jgi:hypothetical protein
VIVTNNKSMNGIMFTSESSDFRYRHAAAYVYACRRPAPL